MSPMSDEQIAKIHETFAESFKRQDAARESSQAIADSYKAQYDKGLRLINDVVLKLLYNPSSYDIDSDDPKCPHCGEDLL